jgi:exodeoxyribonuclease V gamma subunit
MRSPISPGLLILHGNQMELLRAAVFDWLRANPLGPLEEEIILVQSNGVAEWLKIALAEELGVCAATRVALPARFQWEAYRGMLGPERVPRRSPFDKDALTWRLMRLLPEVLAKDKFAPLRHFLSDGDAERRLQLAERLSDLYDQYQVYRADWLTDWAEGIDQLRRPGGDPIPLAPDQCWQAQLWREVHESLPPERRWSGRATIHQQFMAAVEEDRQPAQRLPRRVVLFGMSTLPYQTIEAMAGLSRHTQVLLAVPNPCQFYWGDIIEGRELLTAAYRRHQSRNGSNLAEVPVEELHAHSHPLLASWGRQGRDFVRMLDEFDNGQGAKFGNMRVDLFNEGDGGSLLSQVQAAVRDLLPLLEHPHVPPAPEDRSIEFHIAHSAQREVEVLHDQLLSWFAQDSELRPRDVVVMVPDIDTFSAAVHAVFEQHKRSDPRYIPFEIGDVKDRSRNPRWNGCCACRSSAAARARCATCWTCRRWPRASAWMRMTCRSWAAGSRAPACAGAWTSSTAPAWAWARPASRIPGCSGSAACCWAMPPAPVRATLTSNRMRKWGGSTRPWPAPWPSWWKACWPGASCSTPCCRRRSGASGCAP